MSRRKRDSAEFKHEAIRRANEEGVTDVLVAEELGINARQLRRWREAEKRHGDFRGLFALIQGHCLHTRAAVYPAASMN